MKSPDLTGVVVILFSISVLALPFLLADLMAETTEQCLSDATNRETAMRYATSTATGQCDGPVDRAEVILQFMCNALNE